MKISMLSLKVSIVLIVLSIVSVGPAGKMKEVYFLHEEAVSKALWGVEEANHAPLENTHFVKAEPGQYLAVASDIKIYSPRKNAWIWTTCTTQISQGTKGSLIVTKTVCVDQN